MVLPFNLKPALSTYLYAAYPFGILQKTRVPDPLLNWNIQLAFRERTKPGAHKLTLFPTLNFSTYTQDGLFQSKIYIHGRIPPKAIPGLADEMVRLISERNYLQIYVDYYYIKGTPRYNRKHFRHEMLVYGYDVAHNHFVGALYTGFGNIGEVKIPAPCLIEAFLSPHGRDESSSFYCRGDLLACYRPKLRAAAACSIDLTAIRSQIAWFLDEESMYQDLARRAGNEHDFRDRESTFNGVRFGKNIYAGLASHFEQILAHGHHRLDLRVSRLLWEHKKLMSLRLSRLIDWGWKDIQDILDPWQEIENLARIIHLRVFAARKRKNLSELAGLPKAFENLELRETELLNRFLKVKLP